MANRVKRPEQTRTHITCAAAEALADHGYDGVRMQDVARRAGLTTGAIYAHFDGRAELIAAAVEARASSVLVGELAGAYDDRPLPDRLVDLARRMLADPAATAHPLEVEALVAARREPELAARLGARLNTLHERFAERIVAAQHRGELAADIDPRSAAYFLHALLLGILLLDPAADQRPDQAAWASLVERLVGGLG
jgi:AcrR family transcriptional regulator